MPPRRYHGHHGDFHLETISVFVQLAIWLSPRPDNDASDDAYTHDHPGRALQSPTMRSFDATAPSAFMPWLSTVARSSRPHRIDVVTP